MPALVLIGLFLIDAPRSDCAATAGELGVGGYGRGDCISVAMPCRLGAQLDPQCAARARSRYPGPTPGGKCTIAGLTARGLSAEVLAWLQDRFIQVLPAVCTCHKEGLSMNPRLHGRIGVRVRMKEECSAVDAGGGAPLPDRFTVDCVRSRFFDFSASPPSPEFPSIKHPFAEQLDGKPFELQLDLRPQKNISPHPSVKERSKLSPII